MRKVLMIEDESHLEHALEDVLSLFRFLAGEFEHDPIADLLAVIVMPAETKEYCAWSFQTCDVVEIPSCNRLFSVESVSVDGVWSLLTLNRADLLEPTPRHTSLDRILTSLREDQYASGIARVYPVFPYEEPFDSVSEQLAYLRSTHRDVLAPQPLWLHRKQVH